MNNVEINNYNATIIQRNNALIQEQRDKFIQARTEMEQTIERWLTGLRSNPDVAEELAINPRTIQVKDLVPHAYEGEPYLYKAEIEQELERVNAMIEKTNEIRIRAHEALLQVHQEFDHLEEVRNAGTHTGVL